MFENSIKLASFVDIFAAPHVYYSLAPVFHALGLLLSVCVCAFATALRRFFLVTPQHFNGAGVQGREIADVADFPLATRAKLPGYGEQQTLLLLLNTFPRAATEAVVAAGIIFAVRASVASTLWSVFLASTTVPTP